MGAWAEESSQPSCRGIWVDSACLLGDLLIVFDWPSALLLWLYNLLLLLFMKLRFEVDQADSFRRGIDRAKSIVSIDANPADLPDEARSLIADHLLGIDVLQFFYHNGEVIRGYPIKELSYTSREPKRIVAKTVNIDGLLEAIRANDKLIASIKASFNRPVHFQLIDKPPRNEAEFAFVSDENPAQIEELRQAIRQRRRFWSDCFLSEVQDLTQELRANSYVVCLLPLPPKTAQGRFYCEPVFAAGFNGRQVMAHSSQIVLNHKTGRIVEATNLFQALDIYLLSGVQPGTVVDDLSILTWEGASWVVVAPEGLIDMANDAESKARSTNRPSHE